MNPDALFLALQTALAGRYSLERELGRGGMGIVYLARDVRLDRPVALKLLPPQRALIPELRERFLREARMAARLSHPNIVPIHAVEEAGDFVFYVMRYVAGETLGDRLRRVDGLAPTEAARILRDVAWALAYAHLQGVIHRDIKPDNILLDSPDERAMVTDFGIARLLDDRDKSGERIVGTPEYLSPEQAGGEPVDKRSDLYALGAVGFHCLAGRPPFIGSVSELLTQRITGIAPPLLSVTPNVPSALAAAIDRALSRRPEDRFATAEQMAEAIAPVRMDQLELPVPVRIWVERGRDMKGIYIIWSCFFYGVGIMALVGGLMNGFAASEWVAMVLCAMMATGPWVAHALWRLNETRRAIESGVTLSELRRGVETALIRREEELRFEATRPVHVLARLIRYASYTFFALAFICLLGGVFDSAGIGRMETYFQLFGFFTMLAIGGATFGLIFPGRRVGPRDAFARLRQWFWSGALGATMVKLARIGLKPERQTLKWNSWQATETALGSATEHLFAALPAKQQKALADLPDVVARLEQDASRARERLARGETGAWTDRLEQAVAAIETLRLGLLRMTVGQKREAGSLTADLEAARELSTRIEHQLAGEDEVNALLAGDEVRSQKTERP